MNVARTLRNAIFALGCLSASSALAIPTIKQCQSYRVWSSGVISYSQIAFENNPHPVSNNSAMTSATSRCYNTWMQRGGNNLTYANAGNMQQVWVSSPGYYQYQCLICSDARAPGKFGGLIDAVGAVEQVRTKLDGVVLGVDPKPTPSGDQVVIDYEVSILRDEHLVRVLVEGRTGQVVMPEVLSSSTVYPEPVCR